MRADAKFGVLEADQIDQGRQGVHGHAKSAVLRVNTQGRIRADCHDLTVFLFAEDGQHRPRHQERAAQVHVEEAQRLATGLFRLPWNIDHEMEHGEHPGSRSDLRGPQDDAFRKPFVEHVQGFLAKPFSMADLFQRISELLGPTS